MRPLLVLLTSLTTLHAAPLPAKVVFNAHIRSILSNQCFACHGPDDKHRDADLRLDTREGALADLGGYAAVVPGKPDESELMKRIINHDSNEVMPPPKSKKPPLGERDVALLRRWIEQGAEYEGHWAFLPLAKVTPPAGEKNPIDAFIRSRLASDGLTHSPEADPATLIRRLSIDLTGLLPTPEEVAAFVKNPDVAALADRLLASPHYGERWGRHWLDQARYADSDGYAIDGFRAVWPYRDWVIKAVNDDLPFDQFTIQQLAGDLLPNPTKAQLVATGFHRNTLINLEGGSDPEQFRVEAVMDRVATTGSVWLGLTVGCAQCHTHKFDPISHREYYQFYAFFNHGEDRNNKGATVPVAVGEIFGKTTGELGAGYAPTGEIERLRDEWEAAELKRQRAAGDKADAKLLAALQVDPAARGEPQRKLLNAAFENVEPRAKKKKLGNGDPEAKVVEQMIMRDLPKPRETFLFQRGDFTRPDKAIGVLQPGVIAAVHAAYPAPQKQFANRLDLARWLVDPANPLTPRVTMNRVWMRYFGKGLVETEEDFGTQGVAPTHPELLDWLAGEFIRRGWSLKAMHRLIVTSKTYRQSSHARPELAERDPRNQLLARQERLRVESEIVRDAALCASGLLHPEIGGPSVRPPQPDGVYAFTQNAKSWKTSTGPDRYRRGMYATFYRSAAYPLHTTFDAPNFQTTCTRRIRSNTPLQSLTLANDPAFLEMAVALGVRMARGGDTLDERLTFGFQLALCRPPTVQELTVLRDYTTAQAADFAKDPEGTASARALAPEALKDMPVAEAAALTCAARVLFNTDNFITRE
jgi:mono/diheme cytochrome c family protein